MITLINLSINIIDYYEGLYYKLKVVIFLVKFCDFDFQILLEKLIISKEKGLIPMNLDTDTKNNYYDLILS